jgi:molybdate transport repressor ModE-like protein
MIGIQFLNEATVLSTDRLDLLRLFVAIAETGKISDAARAMGISQPTASRLLKRLEQIFSSQFVQRTASGVTMTRSGADFLHSARQLLQQWDSLSDATTSRQRMLSGHIRVAASAPVGQGFLATIMAKFIRRHPNVTIDLDLRDDQIDLNSIGYDLWVRAGRIHSDKLVVRKIAFVQRALFCAPTLATVEHPRELKALKAIRLTPFVSEATRLTHEHGETYLLKQACALTTNNLYVARAAALEGIGYAILPLWIVRSDVSRGLLRRTCKSWTPEELVFSIAYRPDRNRPARMTELMKYLQAEFSQIASVRRALINHVEALEAE